MCLCMGDSRLTQRSEHFSFTCVYVLLSPRLFGAGLFAAFGLRRTAVVSAIAPMCVLCDVDCAPPHPAYRSVRVP